MPLKFRTLLLRNARLLSEHFNEILLEHQLNYSLWVLIYLIQDKGSITSIDLAKELNVSKPSIAKRVHALTQLGLLEHLPTADKRQKMLCLSEYGCEVFSVCSKKIDFFEQQLLQQFDSAELATASQVLSQLLDVLAPIPQPLKGDHQ